MASSQITPTETLLVELREHEAFPASILLIWPQAPSVFDPRRLGATANAVARLMVAEERTATGASKLAEIRAFKP